MALKPIKITFEGPGFRYALFEVKPEDLPALYDNDKPLLLRSKFREYLREDNERVAAGGKRQMIEFCTLVDTDKYPAEVSLTEGSRILTYHMGKITEWRFIVSNVASKCYEPHMPQGMPNDYTECIKALLAEYIDNVDDTTIDTLNNEYITFFNLYTPEGKMLLCMRARNNVRSEFTIEIEAGETAEIDKLCILCRQAQGIAWNDYQRHREYDANSLVYDNQWHTGTVYSHHEMNADYFVTGSDPSSIDARWYESWAML